MKNDRFNIYILVLSLLVVISCSKDQDVAPDPNRAVPFPDIAEDTENIPQWIYEEMSFFYFWNENLPEEGPTGEEDPRNYFYSLTNPNDFFSYISDDAESIKEENSGTIMASGFSTTYGVFTNSDNLFAIVEFVYPGSPADKAGLQRGDIILKINGEDISDANFISLTDNDVSSVTLGEFDGQSIRLTNEVVSINRGTVDLNPVIHYEVKEIEGKKIGYLVYVSFISGEENKWLNSLREALGNMKLEGVSEFILDLRYNPGGNVRVARYLASALAPLNAVANNEILVRYEYNDQLQDYFLSRQGEDSRNIISRLEQNENNLNLTELYVLTSGTTASASELIINGLKPYMNVTVIGEPTFGKFYGSYLLYDENDPPKHNWAISPVILKYANANGVSDFVNGLQPDIFIQDDLLNAKDFGDDTDPMVSAALSIMKGEDLSGARISSERQYEPVYDMHRIKKGNVFFDGLDVFYDLNF